VLSSQTNADGKAAADDVDVAEQHRDEGFPGAAHSIRELGLRSRGRPAMAEAIRT